MKILVIHSNDISNYPPVKSLIENLNNNSHDITVIARDENGILNEINPNIHQFLLNSYTGDSKKDSIIYLKNKILIKKYSKELIKSSDIVWTTTSETVREVGNELLNCDHHVMQMMELIQYEPLIPFQNILKFNIKKYAKHAWKVVVPEINRAYIQKVWWQLEKLPIVLPNKPYSLPCGDMPEELVPYVNAIKNDKKTKVLYQGVFFADRNLEQVAQAIEKNSDKYSLYIMGHKNEYCDSLCKRHPIIQYIPFTRPPYHMLITQEADIGLLPYVPQKVYNTSVLNALYCAPNKIFEYAACKLPMVGSDVLGLKYPFEKYNIGVCCNDKDVNELIDAFNYINNNLTTMKENCMNFYNSIDLDEIVQSILYN